MRLGSSERFLVLALIGRSLLLSVICNALSTVSSDVSSPLFRRPSTLKPPVTVIGAYLGGYWGLGGLLQKVLLPTPPIE